MAVTAKCALGISVRSLIFGVGRQLPDDDRLIAGGGQDDVGVVDRCSEGCDPAGMALEVTSQGKCFSHCWGVEGDGMVEQMAEPDELYDMFVYGRVMQRVLQYGDDGGVVIMECSTDNEVGVDRTFLKSNVSSSLIYDPNMMT